MSSLEYKDSSGISVGYEFAASVLSLSVSNNIWFAIARVILKSIVVLSQPQNIAFRVLQVRETIVIEWEDSNARIRTEKLIRVTQTYTRAINSINVRLPEGSSESKKKLAENLNRMLDKHIEEIIESG